MQCKKLFTYPRMLAIEKAIKNMQYILVVSIPTKSLSKFVTGCNYRLK